MIIITEKVNCIGCHACASVCPKGCIKMVCDEEGFLYPVANAAVCVNCGLCEKVCPIINDVPLNVDVASFAVKSKDDTTRLKSSSGGVFSLLAEQIINNGGVVFGAAFNEDFTRVEHVAVTDMKQLYKLQGSKYVQSIIGDAYKEVKRHLEEGVTVYFSGTPCQVAGLYAFLNKKYENLITQDFICHGVPSQEVWRRYLATFPDRSAVKIENVFFRHKSSGWKNYSMQISFSDGSKYEKPHSEDLYMRGFLSNLYLRPSCHKCKFKTVNHCSDITLADFWGVEKFSHEMDDNKGTSLVICHSSKGEQLLVDCSKSATIVSVDTDRATSYNLAIVKSAIAHPKRAEFFENLYENSIDAQIKLFLKEPFYKLVLRKFNVFIKRTLNKLRKRKLR